jgi:murein DD-endopeptidase MepM/ murein hydrolase activator NlpD
VERESDQPLLNWSELYDANHDEFDASRILVLATEKRTHQDQDAYYKAAVSPLTAYTYVNIPYGNVVWSIWMNSTNEEYQNVLKHIADSIRFGKNAPKTLTQAYGDDFKPQPLVPQNSQGKDVNDFLGNNGSFSMTLNNYTVPVNESVSLKCGSANAPVCGGTHSGSAGEAIDIGVTYKIVYAAATSFYHGSQWSNTGYGNLIKLRDYQNNVAYYAHLNWFTNPNNYFSQGQLVGQSGSSGTNSPHLHFHVQNGSTPVDLSGMVGLYLNSNYPNCNKETCEEIEELNNEECTCGQVN